MQAILESPISGDEVPPGSDAFRPEFLQDKQIAFGQRLFQDFMDRLAQALAQYFLTPAEARLVGLEQASLSQALIQENDRGCLATLELNPVQGAAYVVIGGGLAAKALGLLLGAPADVPEVERALLTEVDIHLLHGFIHLLASELRESCRAVCDSSFRVLRVTAGDAEIGSPAGDPHVVVMRAEVTLDGCSGVLSLLVPSLLIRLACMPDQRVEDVEQQGRLMAAMGSVSVAAEAVLRGAAVRIRDLIDLRPGHTLLLPHRADAPIFVEMNGLPKLTGELVEAGNSVSFQVRSRQ